MHKISIIIVNWNGKHWLEKCLPSLKAQNYKNIEIIIVDNCSSDGSVRFLKKNYPEVLIIKNKQNVGYAEANNIGFRKATGEFILFLNNDTVVTVNFLKPLVRTLLNDKRIGGAQSRIRLLDKPKYLDSVAAFLTNTGFLYHYGIAKPDQLMYRKRVKIFSAKGACMLFRKSVLDSVLIDNQLFDQDYFAYFEETDMCYRVWLSGFSIVYEPNSLIYHKMGGTSSGMDNSFVQYHSFKNRINSYLKNCELATLIKILPVHFILIEMYALLFLLKGNINMFAAIQRAVQWNFTVINQTLHKRNRIQMKIKKVSDSHIFRYVFINPRPEYYYKLLTGLDAYIDTPVR